MAEKKKTITKEEWEHSAGQGRENFPGFGRESPDDLSGEGEYEDIGPDESYGRDNSDEMPEEE